MNATVTAKTLAMSGVIACGLGVLGASAASATVYFDNAFSTETPNTANNVPVVGYDIDRGAVTTGSYSLAGGMMAPTDAQGSTSAGGRRAMTFAANPLLTGFNSQSVGLFSHSSVYGGGDEGVIRIAHQIPANNGPLTGTTAGQYVFSFDLSVKSATMDTSVWTVKPAMTLLSNYWDSTGGNQGNRPLLSVWESAGNIILTSSTGAPGGASMDTNIVTGFTALTPYSIAATMDMDTRTFTVSVNGTPVGGTFNQLEPAYTGKGIGEYIANGGRPDTGAVEGTYHFYDNIKLETVPEPTSLALLGLSAAGLLLRRKRH